MKLMAGNANRPLAEEISDYLDTPLSKVEVKRFNDNEIFVEVRENVRGADVFIVQPTSFPANDNLMELLIMIDAVQRASAQRKRPARQPPARRRRARALCERPHELCFRR